MTKRDQPVFIYGALAAVLLLSLLKMPYGFYEFVRFAAMAAFAYLVYKEYDNKGSKDKMILFIVLAVLFQPFFKLSLSRVIWNIVDVVVAGLLLVLLFNTLKGKK